MIRIKRKIWLPVVIWLALFLVVFNLANHFQDTKFALANAFYEIGTSCAIYYLTASFLFPKFYKRGKGYFWISFIFILIIALFLFFIDISFISDLRGSGEADRPPKVFHIIRYIMSVGFTFFVATSLSFLEHTRELQANEKVLSEEKLQTELKLLKAQINPHFIFNALNNIYSLTYMQSANAPDSVLKLSEMLRYVFYECDKDRVLLSSEIKYVENFTAFQQMKSDFKQNIQLHNDLNGEQIELAPMLMIPFIENAFKYSRIEEYENAFVKINVKHSQNQLFFNIVNSVPDNKPNSGSGMGIENVKHRLDIIYPGRYELKIDENNKKYNVDLSLKL